MIDLPHPVLASVGASASRINSTTINPPIAISHQNRRTKDLGCFSVGPQLARPSLSFVDFPPDMISYGGVVSRRNMPCC
jgi:hypothetical protein